MKSPAGGADGASWMWVLRALVGVVLVKDDYDGVLLGCFQDHGLESIMPHPGRTTR